MIFRYYTECPGCNAKTMLRLQIGIDEYQPFYFVCQKCGAPTRGSLKINYDVEPPSAELELEDCILLDSSDDSTNQIITIALDLPCVLSSDEDPGSQYPFIYQSELMGSLEKVREFQQRISTFRGTVKSDWQKVKRLIAYYITRNWKQFDNEWNKIFEKVIPTPKNEFERHDYLHRALELMFVSLQPEFDYPLLKEEYNHFFSKTAVFREISLRGFVRNLSKSKELADHQRNLLERLTFVVDNFSALSSGFPVLFYLTKHKHDAGILRIMRDDFEILKIHYLSCFEIAHKILGILVGLVNIHARGDANAFIGGKPISLKRFMKLPNAQKPSHLDAGLIPEIASRWNNYFDRNLRNSIGHYNVHHDLKSGYLLLDNAPSIPYSWFVASCLKLTPILLYCLQIVKMIYISNWLINNKE